MKLEARLFSKGTFQLKDLIEAAENCLQYLTQCDEISNAAHAIEAAIAAMPHRLVPSYARDDDASDWWESNDACDAYEQMIDAIDSCVNGHGLFWGSSTGNLSDIGLFPFEEETE